MPPEYHRAKMSNRCRGYFQLNGINLNAVSTLVMGAGERPITE